MNCGQANLSPDLSTIHQTVIHTLSPNHMTIVFSKYKMEAITRVEMFVMEKFHVSKMDLYGVARYKDLAGARFVAWYLLYTVFHFSSPEIGKLFGKDHTSVLNGIDRVKTLEWDREAKRQFKNSYPHFHRANSSNK
jgi:chromosomal replication initiation ATPase DnaA